jgi:hypothetical protein
MSIIEHQNNAATRLNNCVRVILAKRKLKELVHKRKMAIQAAKEQAEREARERERKERIAREKAAAAEALKKAREAAERAERMEREKAERLKMETIKRKKEENEAAAARAALEALEAEAQAAREAAERMEREAAEETERIAKAKAEEERKQQQAAAAEEAEKAARRKRQEEDFSRMQGEARLKSRQDSEALQASGGGEFRGGGGGEGGGAASPGPDPFDAFSELLSDDGIDSDMRDKLAAMAAKRRADEVGVCPSQHCACRCDALCRMCGASLCWTACSSLACAECTARCAHISSSSSCVRRTVTHPFYPSLCFVRHMNVSKSGAPPTASRGPARREEAKRGRGAHARAALDCATGAEAQGGA